MTKTYTHLSSTELVSEITTGIKNSITIVKQLEEMAEQHQVVSEKEVVEQAGAAMMFILEMTLSKVNDLLGEVDNRQNSEMIIEALLAKLDEFMKVDGQYFVSALLLTGTISLGELFSV